MLCLILSLALLLSLPSCAVIDRFKGDMSKIDYDDQGRLLYGERKCSSFKKLFRSKTYFLECFRLEKFV